MFPHFQFQDQTTAFPCKRPGPCQEHPDRRLNVIPQEHRGKLLDLQFKLLEERQLAVLPESKRQEVLLERFQRGQQLAFEERDLELQKRRVEQQQLELEQKRQAERLAEEDRQRQGEAEGARLRQRQEKELEAARKAEAERQRAEERQRQRREQEAEATRLEEAERDRERILQHPGVLAAVLGPLPVEAHGQGPVRSGGNGSQ